jgi:hypothetical protein
LAECVERFNAAPTARLRSRVIWGTAAAWALLVLLSLLARQRLVAGGFLGLGLMTAVSYFIIHGLTEKSYPFQKSGELLAGAGLGDWLTGLAALALIVMLLVVFHLLWAWVAFGVLAVLAAYGLHSTVDRRLAEERSGPLASVALMFKSLRTGGVDEQAIRQFACRYGGERWEGFYEALFGYEARREAGLRWGSGGRRWWPRTFADWRDPIVDWLDAKQRDRRAQRDRRLLQKVEEKGMEAQGVNLLTARRRAQRAAEAMVVTATELNAAARQRYADRSEQLAIARAIREAAERPEDVLVERESGLDQPRTEGVWERVFSSRVRFLAGALLLAACLVWMDQNQIVTGAQLKEAAAKVRDVATKAVETKDVGVVRDLKTGDLIDETTIARAKEAFQKGSKPLELPMLPPVLAKRFDGFNPGVAGLILIVSSFFRGNRLSVAAVAGAASAWLGPSLGFSTTGLGDLRLASMALGVALLAVGVLFGRRHA